MKRIRLEVVERATYTREFNVADNFDINDREKLTNLWITHSASLPNESEFIDDVFVDINSVIILTASSPGL